MGTGLGLLFLGLGTYMSWRGFSFLVDAITRRVTYVTAAVGRDITYSSRSGNFYYLVVGPTKTWIAPKVFDALPVGLLCHAYYSPCSRHLLSMEPANAGDPPLSLRFGDADARAWARFRWGWFFAASAAFGLAAGIRFVIIGHPASGVPTEVLSVATFALLFWVRKHPRPESTDFGQWKDSDVNDAAGEENDADVIGDAGSSGS